MTPQKMAESLQNSQNPERKSTASTSNKKWNQKSMSVSRPERLLSNPLTMKELLLNSTKLFFTIKTSLRYTQKKQKSILNFVILAQQFNNSKKPCNYGMRKAGYLI